MHKDKQGNVLASLTEVKNKTGDIFALVDEFGEVFITSYNKTRYRISKMDISGMLSEKTEKAPKVKVKVAKEEKKEKAEEPKAEHKEESGPEHTNIKLEEYDRNNKSETQFVKEALKPLVNN